MSKCPLRLFGILGRRHTWERVMFHGHPIYRVCANCGRLK